MDEFLTSWFGPHFVCSLHTSHLRVDFTSLHNTGKPLLGGFRLTGLVGSCRSDDQAAKYEDNSERSH
jgi:hypothetical protein